MVGLGSLAREVHLPLLEASRHCEVVALADPDADALERAAALVDHRAERSTDPLSLCADAATSIDAVLIASPTPFHAEQAAAALRAGHHVYLEKPVAASHSEAEELARIRLDAGQVLQVGLNYRFDPAYEDIARRMKAGSLGPVRRVSMAFAAPLDPRGTWREAQRPGGGVLLDLFSHDVDLLGFFGFRFVEVSATAHGDSVKVLGALRTASCGEADVEFEGEYSFRAGDRAHCRLETDGGVLSYDRYRDFAPVVHRGHRRSLTTGVRNAARQMASLGVVVERRRSPWRQPTFRRALRSFVQAIQGGGVGELKGATLADGLASLRVVEAAQRSLGHSPGSLEPPVESARRTDQPAKG